MSDVAQAAQPRRLLDIVASVFRHQDLLFAAGIVTLVAVLVLPMPTVIVDVGLSASITLSVLILMVAIWIDKPLDFSSFPTVLLIATMLRLALNLATTRLILTNGHKGLQAAGSVINGFAAFVVGGDFVIGVVVFAILIVINFMVITKGAGRIAEVAARFSLDAMPGKQMAIDAELSAGSINDIEARRRRRELEEESSFYGAMDGASKFVRGDAIAAIIVTLVNAIGGIVIGTLRHGLGVGQAATFYTTLTIGDGIVSQIPALIVSLGAGMLVSKGSLRGSTDRAFIGQLGNHAKPLFLAAGLAGLFAFLPGLPFLPFAGLSAATIGAAILSRRAAERRDAAAAAAARSEEKVGGPQEEPLGELMHVDDIRIELGMALVPLASGPNGGLTEKIRKLRRAIALDYGFLLPAVRIKDNMDLAAGEYSLEIQGVEVARETMMLNKLLAFSPEGRGIGVQGQDTREPSFQIPARWIDPGLRQTAVAQGLTVVDAETILTTHLSETVKANMSQLMSYAATQKLLAGLAPDQQKLAQDLVPALVPMSTVQKILAGLLAERVSIRHLPLVLESIHEAASHTRNVRLMIEHVRVRLAMQICKSLMGGDGFIAVMPLSPEWEREINEAIIVDGEQRSFVLPPTRTQEFVQAVRAKIAMASSRGVWPAVLTSAEARPFVRALIERINPTISIISHAEVHPTSRLRTVEQI
ncbi:MAG: flagellar biosynthesis protein FlhA [Alphaproteobacteria bacterium]|nr:flagellar biosynthesis protein FlhA [Alphaproteobacteria bacterium]